MKNDLARAERRKGAVLVFIAALIWSTAGPLMRMLHLDIWTIQLWRGVFGAAFLIGSLFISHRGDVIRQLTSLGWLDYACAAMGTIAMFSYVSALAYTSVADVVVVYATLPFISAIFGLLINGEKVGPRTLVASLIALAGMVVMVGGSGSSSNRLLGDALSLLMTVSFAMLVVLMRRNPGKSIALINAIGALWGVVICLFLVPSQAVPAARDLWVLAGLGTITIGAGLLIFIVGSRLIPSAEAGLIGLIEVVLSPLWVWLAFNENPGEGAIIGGVIVLAAVAWQMLGELRQETAASLPLA